MNKNIRHRLSRWIPGLITGIFAVLLSGSGLTCQGNNTGPAESVVVAYAPFESTALLWVAENQQYFSRNGLNVTLRKYDTGAMALGGTMKGEAEIAAGISEFPAVRMAFQKEKMAIVGNIDWGEFIYFIGRQDSGIQNVADLKGRKIGTAVGTIAQFYLGRFLELNGLRVQDINLVDLKTPAEWVNAVVNGQVDVVVTAQPDANTIKERLGENAFFWPAQGGQFLHGLVISTQDWENQHPVLVQKFLKALLQAEEYARRNPEKAKAVVQKGLNLDAGYMETVWSQNQFSLSLNQALVLAMEDEARWMISNSLTTEKTIPNFLDYIYTDSLKSVKPEAVRITGK
jgi:ABC-type nitrate/sulfonate/bicarbonate transport system substrate-binding protein